MFAFVTGNSFAFLKVEGRQKQVKRVNKVEKLLKHRAFHWDLKKLAELE